MKSNGSRAGFYSMRINNGAGFTLVEVLVVICIFVLLLGLPMAFFWGIGRGDALEAQAREVVAVLHEAQTNTISGRSQDGQQPTNFGIYFGTTYYDVFSGSSYSANDPKNQRNDLPSGITFSQIQLPNNEVIFAKVTGQVSNFDVNQKSLTLLENNTGKAKHITIVKVGSITHD